MKKSLALWGASLILTATILNSCSPIPHQSNSMAVTVAKQEMQRRGWKQTKVERCFQRDGLWVVQMHPQGDRIAFASVTVSSNGIVENVFVNTK